MASRVTSIPADPGTSLCLPVMTGAGRPPLAAALMAAAMSYMSLSSLGYESAFRRTPVGEGLIKEIPATTLLVTQMPGSYFENADELFMRLFRFIRRNHVKMTVPVEAKIEAANLRFYVGAADAARGLKSDDSVAVLALPSRTVASFGARGGYTARNVNQALDRLNAWLKERSDYRAIGEPTAGFWSSPLVPSFLRRFEVNLEVERVATPQPEKAEPPPAAEPAAVR